MWTIKFRNGTMKRFKFPIRTTPEGSIDPYGGKPKANMADIANDRCVHQGMHGGDRASSSRLSKAIMGRRAWFVPALRTELFYGRELQGLAQAAMRKEICNG